LDLAPIFLGKEAAGGFGRHAHGSRRPPTDGNEFRGAGGEPLAIAAVIEKEIDHEGITLRGGMTAFAGGGAGNDGGTGVDGQILAHSGDFDDAAVRDDAGVDGAMAVMETNARGADAPFGVVISLGRPIGGDAGQSSACDGTAGV